MIALNRLCGPVALLACTVLPLVGCHPPGKPGPDSAVLRPEQVTDFPTLYRQNCQACHGAQGHNGMAVSLANPVYIAYAGQQRIAEVTANGIPNSLMPGFAVSQGGLLTDQQIHVLAEGIVHRWSNPGALGRVAPPAYETHAPGNAVAGETLYRTDCLRCHAPGTGSILDPTYLALVSDTGLRTLLVTGKPAEGMPDWRSYAGGPLSSQQLTDLVSFLASKRTSSPGQPFANAEEQSGPAKAIGVDAALEPGPRHSASDATTSPAMSQPSMRPVP